MVAVIIYIVIGLIGVPIFSTGGGFGYVLGPTFGFLIGFIPASYVCGKLSENMKKLNILPAIIALIIIYIIGASYFFIIQNLYFSKFVSVWNVVSGCVLVFLPFDCILSALVLIIAKRINKAKVM